MKGRKPKYSRDLVAELAARISAGESPSALAKEKGMSRSSVRRCAESARLPAEIKEQNLEEAAQVSTAKQREKLFWRFIETYLRQGIALAPKSTPRDVAGMIEAAVKLRSLMPPVRTSARLPECQKSSETLLIFQRSLSQPAENANEAEVVEEVQEGLDKANRAELETRSDERRNLE